MAFSEEEKNRYIRINGYLNEAALLSEKVRKECSACGLVLEREPTDPAEPLDKLYHAKQCRKLFETHLIPQLMKDVPELGELGLHKYANGHYTIEPIDSMFSGFSIAYRLFIMDNADQENKQYE